MIGNGGSKVGTQILYIIRIWLLLDRIATSRSHDLSLMAPDRHCIMPRNSFTLESALPDAESSPCIRKLLFVRHCCRAYRAIQASGAFQSKSVELGHMTDDPRWRYP